MSIQTVRVVLVGFSIGSGIRFINLDFTGATYPFVNSSGIWTDPLGASNLILGVHAGASATTGASRNTGIGTNALQSVTTGVRNTGVGYTALLNNITGDHNTSIGYQAGPATSALTNTIAIGSGASLTASNTGVIGNSSITDFYFGSTSGLSTLHAANTIGLSPPFPLDQSIAPTWTGQHIWEMSDAGTSNILYPIDIDHETSGTPIATYGVGISVHMKDATNVRVLFGTLDFAWNDPTHATRNGYMTVNLPGNGDVQQIATFTGGGGLSVGQNTFHPDLPNGVIDAETGFRVNNTAPSGKILKGDGTNYIASTETYAAPGTNGNLMKSDGTNWISSAPGSIVFPDSDPHIIGAGYWSGGVLTRSAG